MEKENNIYYRDNPKLFDELELLFEENKKILCNSKTFKAIFARMGRQST